MDFCGAFNQLLVTFVLLWCNTCALSVIVAHRSEGATTPASISTETLTVRHSDSMEVGISNILSIVENIEEMSDTQFINDLTSDRTHLLAGSALLRQIRDVEYHPYPCNISCFIRPPWYASEVQRLLRLMPVVGGAQSFVLDCLHKDTSDIPNGSHLVSVDCVSHYTGRLIHVILKLENSDSCNVTETTVIVPGGEMAATLSNLLHRNTSTNAQSATGLYVTFTLPLTEITFADLQPVEPWLRYLALSGEHLLALDKLLLTNLSLDYFVLEGCKRIEERINAINEKINAYLISPRRCVVVWKFECHNSVRFELWADNKTQSRLCGHPETLAHVKRDYRLLSTKNPRRARRSAHRRRLDVDYLLPTTPSSAIQIEEESSNPDVSTRMMGIVVKDATKSDISWYKHALTLVLGTVLILSMLLFAMAVTLLLLIRRILRIKLKPV